MPRPALIIGLGGTGEWVATYVKKDLLEIGNGRLPPNVRLLCFDLMPRGEAEVRGAGAAVTGREEQKRAEVGLVKLLDNIEFIDLGGNIYELSRAIAAEERAQGANEVLRNLGAWFQAGDYLGALTPADFDLSRGAGQIRQFGRMAVFEDLTRGKRELRIRLERAMTELQGAVQQAQTPLEVIIVVSFAGGTGAGMLIDVANLARKLARDVLGGGLTRAFIVLPNAFSWVDDLMRARGFAAWRELDRFMLIHEDGLGLRDIAYSEDLRIPVETWPFDATYLVGGDRPRHSLKGTDHRWNTCPAVADAISAILDSEAGTRFTQLAANLRPRRLAAGKEDIPLHSSIGAYTIKAPVYYARETFNHKLALKVLETLAPLQRDAQGKVIGLKPDARADRPGDRGEKEVAVFLDNQPVTARGVSVSNTLFTPQMREILSATGAERQQMITYYAQYAGEEEGTGAGVVLSAFTKQAGLPVDALKRIDEARDVQLVQEVLPSWDYGDTTFEAMSRYGQKDEGGVEPFVEKYYGYLDRDGTDFRGLLGQSLEICKQAQLDIFHKRLHTWLQGALQGETGEAERDLAGRLGYAKGFLRGLEARVREFQDDFIAKVIKERSRLGLTAKAHGVEDDVQQYLVNHPRIRRWSELGVAGRVASALIVVGLAAGSVILFLQNPALWWALPVSGVIILALAVLGLMEKDNGRAEKVYLDAVQARINERKADIVYNIVGETLDEMLAVCHQARDQLQHWAEALVLGNPQRDVEALWARLGRVLERVQTNWEADKELADLQKQVEISAELTEEDVARVLSSIGWAVGPDFALTCTIREPDGTPRQMRLNPDGTVDPSLLMRAASRQFRPRLEGKRIAAQLRLSEDFPTAESLAEELHDRAWPMYSVAPAATRGQSLGSTHLIRVKHAVDPQSQKFFHNRSQDEEEWGVIQWLRKRLPGDVELVGSEDEYKLTAVRTADLMESGYFAQYEECRKAYIQHIEKLGAGIRDPESREKERIRKAKRLHLFPALVNAIEYEVRLMADLAGKYRPLHDKVVAVLEDKERARQFFLLMAYGFITEAMDAGKAERWYELRLPGRDPLYLTRPAPGELDIFQAINTFVVRRRDARSDRETEIDKRAVEPAIQEAQRDLVAAVYQIRRAMDTDVVAKQSASQDKARNDLGHVARLMYKEQIGYLRVSSPRVVGLLELESLARQRLEQFFDCLAQGIIAEKREANDRWYQLTTRRQRIYLSTPGPGEPDIFQAIATFTEPEKGRDVRTTGPGSNAPIDYEEVETELGNRKQNLVRTLNNIRHQCLSPEGIVLRLLGAEDIDLQHLSQLADLIYGEAYGRLAKGSPKVAQVLQYDRQDLVRDFSLCCAYGLIGRESDRQTGNQWLQLSWPGNQICLTIPGLGRPDVFAAVETFVLVGGDARGELGERQIDKIDYERITRVLQGKESKLVEALQRLDEPEHWGNVLWKEIPAEDAEYRHLLRLAEAINVQRAELIAGRSPRVTRLVERVKRDRVQEFFTCHAYDLVQETTEGNLQWYRLKFSHVAWGEKEYYLTEPQRRRPDILKAAETYLSGEDVRKDIPSDQAQIEYQAVTEVLDTLERADPRGRAEKLKHQVSAEDGLVKQLQRGNSDERYLADLVYEVLQERLEVLTAI